MIYKTRSNMKYIIMPFLGLMALSVSAQQQIRSAGAPSMLPLTKEISNAFVKETGGISPLMTSNGTASGIHEFCSGVGGFSPDVTSAVRPIKKNELENCFKNGVTDIIQLTIGKNGLCFIHSSKALEDKKIQAFSLTTDQIAKAVLKELPAADGSLKPNTYQNWNEIDSTLPKAPIKVLIPPVSNGDHENFQTMILEPYCDSTPWVRTLKTKDPEKYKSICYAVREGTNVRTVQDFELADNGNVLVDTIVKSPLGTIAVIAFDLYTLHVKSSIQPLSINNIKPSIATLKNHTYPLIYTLEMYYKKANFATTKGLEDFMKFYPVDFIGVA